MAKKFHVNGEGKPGVCHAGMGKTLVIGRPRGCPFGGEDEHYATPELARAAYEKSMEDRLNESLEAKSGTDGPVPARSWMSDVKDLGTRESSAAVRYAMEAVDQYFTPELVQKWLAGPVNSSNHRLAAAVDYYRRRGDLTEGQLANLVRGDGSTAYEVSYLEIKEKISEKVDLENAEAGIRLRAKIGADKARLLSETGLEDPSYEYDRKPVVVEPVPDSSEVVERSSELSKEIEALKADMPIYHKLWKSWRTMDFLVEDSEAS